MKISTKGRYAMRLLIDLNENQGDGFVALKDIAQRQSISKKISRADSARAHGRGYFKDLTRLSGRLPPCARAGGYPGRRGAQTHRGQHFARGVLDSSPNECPRCTDCLTLPVWQGLERVINEYLDGVSLRDVLDGNVK